MFNTRIRCFRTLILVVLLSAASAICANAAPLYLTNSFDTLNNLIPASNTNLSIDNINYVEGSGSLRMTWNATANDTGYFDWNLPGVFDFTNSQIQFSAYPPIDITEIGFQLIDINNEVVESWRWSVLPPWYNRFNTFSVLEDNPSGATFYADGLGDITRIVRARWIEKTNSNGIRFNEWDNAVITPEPGTSGLLGIGLCGLFWKKRVVAEK